MKKYELNYQILPLDNLNQELIESLSTDIRLNDQNNIFVSGVSTITKLILRNDYPVKIKRNAITQILRFLHHVEAQLITFPNRKMPIHFEIWQKYFHDTTYKRFMKILDEENILSVVPYEDGKFYVKEQRSYLYKLQNQYFIDTPCLVVMENNNTRHFESDKKYRRKFTETLRESKIDFKLALVDEIKYNIKEDKSQYSLKARISTLLALNGRRFIFTGKKSDRVYHSFSNISKVSRKHLTFKNKKFLNIDVVNSQPLLLSYLLKSKGLEVDDLYVNFCENGKIYEQFLNINGNFRESYIKDGNKKYFFKERTLTTRDQVKKELYSSIFFDFKIDNPVNKAFKNKFPKTYASIESLHTDENNTLASQLQNIEASVFNEIYPVKSEGYYTLFDSIYYTSEKDTTDILKNIFQKFYEFGIKPKLTVTNYNTETENIVSFNDIMFE